MIFNSLPQEIIHHILSYNDAIKHRNGKYMNQISKTDKRYELLLKISPIEYINISASSVIHRPTNTLWLITLTPDKIYNAFFYDKEEIPKKCDLWVRY